VKLKAFGTLRSR